MKQDNGDKKVSREELMRIMQRFAGNTAHDMNNILTPIVGFGRMLNERLTDEDDQADLKELLTAAERGMELCNRYGEMAHFSQAETLPGDLVHALRSAETMFAKKLGAATIQWELPAVGTGAQFDPVQFFMVLDHIASNAGQAMSTGSGKGTFTVSLAEPAGDDGELAVSFSDTGPGFPEDVLKNFGLPFNTDQKEHKLSGTGLALSRSAVMEWGGRLRAENTDGGARIVLTLLPGTVSQTQTKPVDQPATAGSAGCVLLLESEASESERMASDLRSAGYEVHATLDSAGERPFDFGLVALGYPEEMDQLVALKAHSPDATLFRLATGMSGGLFITKPATKESLLEKLQGE